MWKGKLEAERAIADEGGPQLQMPARIAARLQAAAGVPGDSGAFYRSMAKVIEARPGAPAVTLVQGVLEVRDSESAENFNTLRFMLSSDEERYLLRKLVVTDLEGEELARSSGQDIHTQTADPTMATDALILNVPVPGLRAGQPRGIRVVAMVRGIDRRTGDAAAPSVRGRHPGAARGAGAGRPQRRRGAGGG